MCYPPQIIRSRNGFSVGQKGLLSPIKIQIFEQLNNCHVFTNEPAARNWLVSKPLSIPISFDGTILQQ